MPYWDLHMHSALSPCGDDDMTPNNIVNMALLSGLNAIALTDHNSVKNCPAAMKVGQENGLLVVPGMELTTAEEIHVVCLFPSLEAALGFGEAVDQALPPIPNRPEIFGNQLVLDENDQLLTTEPKLLINATSIGLYQVPSLASSFGGLAILAHIDRHANGVLGILGDIDPDAGYRLAEVSRRGSVADYAARFPFLSFRSNSDAHQLSAIADADEISFSPLSAATPGDLLRALSSLPPQTL